MVSEGCYRASKGCRLTFRNLRAASDRRTRLNTDDDGDDDDLRKELESTLRKLEKEDGLSFSCCCISLRMVISADRSWSRSSRQKESLMLVLASLLRTSRRSLFHCSSSFRIICTASSDVTWPATLHGDRELHA
jgi:hypothetical protein